MLTQTAVKTRPQKLEEPKVEIRLSEVLSALTFALDLTEGQPEGHAIRCCMIGMSFADHLQLNSEERSALFYALLLKDLGCSSNSAKVTNLFNGDDHRLKYRLKTVNWSNYLRAAQYVFLNAAEGRSLLKRTFQVISLGLKGPAAATDLIKTRCERGADIARSLGFPELTAQAILDLDEHWNGHGDPNGLKGNQISLLGRILGIAQTVEVFFTAFGPGAAKDVARARRGSWFDPALSDLFLNEISAEKDFWKRLKSPDLINQISGYEPEDRVLLADDNRLDEIADAFARVIDAKSPYTVKHSTRVTEIVLGMAQELRMPASERRDLSRAALLHDIGKLGVSNMILDKQTKLTESEWEEIRKHPEFTYLILRRVNGFRHLADVASAHHERLDGKGYHRHLRENELPATARLLVVADQYEAMTATRPYREALPSTEALQILEAQVGTGVDGRAFRALRDLVAKGKAPPSEPLSD